MTDSDGAHIFPPRADDQRIIDAIAAQGGPFGYGIDGDFRYALGQFLGLSDAEILAHSVDDMWLHYLQDQGLVNAAEPFSFELSGAPPAVDTWVRKDFQPSPESIGGGVRYDMFWNAGGTRVWTCRDGSNRCDQYDVSPAFSIAAGDWTNRVSDNTNFPDPRGMHFSPDGLIMTVNTAGGQMRRATLSTPFDISTLGVFSNTFMGTSHFDHIWSADGTRLWMYFASGVPTTIREYAVPTPFDVTSIVPNAFTDVARFDVAPDATRINSFQFNSDGTIIYAIADNPGAGSLVQWTLSTPYDITTAGSFVQGISVGTAGEMGNPRGLFYRPTDGCLYAGRDQNNPQNYAIYGPP